MAIDTTKFYGIPKEQMANTITPILYGIKIAIGDRGALVCTFHTATITITDYPLPPHLQEASGRKNGCAVHFVVPDLQKSLFKKPPETGWIGVSHAMNELSKYEV